MNKSIDCGMQVDCPTELPRRRGLCAEDEPPFLEPTLSTTSRRSPVEVRTLIVDDSIVLQEVLGSLLKRCGGFQVVGTAANGRQALEQVAGLQPDLVLMDWRMPVMDGLEATRHLKALPEPPVVVFMPLEDDPVLRAEARAAGADGFVGKQELPAKLPRLLQEQFCGAGKLPHSLGDGLSF